MKKSNIMKKGAVLTLAAVMAFGLYSPAAVFATEIPEDASSAIEKQQAAPAAEKQIEAVAPQTEVKKDSSEVKEVKEAPAIEKQEAPAVKEEAPVVEEKQAPAAEESQYGTEKGWGYGNDSKTTKWVEYEKDGKSILVFSTIGDENTDEENAVTKLLDENGNSAKDDLKGRVNQIIFETGITGIGWTALYDKKFYEPVYGEGYYVDQSQTDLFNSFTKLTVVTPCETIKRIGWSAFRKCYSLKEFDFSKCTGLEEIMNQAFSECHSLNNVDLSDCNSLETIAWGAFNNAGRGTNASLTLPTSGVLSVIGGKAFLNFASKSTNGEVDFTPVANTVTKILQSAFEGTQLTGVISGYKNLEVVGNNAFLKSSITYVPYDPSQDEPVAEEPAKEEPVVEEPTIEEPTKEEPVVEEPVVEEPAAEEILPAAQDKIIPTIQEEVIPAIQDVVAPVASTVNDEAVVTASADTAKAAASTKAAASGKAAASNNGAVISDSAAPAVAPATSTINDSAVSMTAPAADEQSGSSLGYVLGGLGAALLMAMGALAINRKRVAANE